MFVYSMVNAYNWGEFGTSNEFNQKNVNRKDCVNAKR